MKILVLNCGSSSIKYKLFNMDSHEVLAQGAVEKIGLAGSFLKLELPDGQKVLLEGEVLEHRAGIEYILGVLISDKYGCIKSMDEIGAVGHRVVHGGEQFNNGLQIRFACAFQPDSSSFWSIFPCSNLSSLPQGTYLPHDMKEKENC